MYIKNVKTTEESVIIYYPTVFISFSETQNSATIKQITLSAQQNLEKNNTVNINAETKFIYNIIKDK